jgi:hypothetical protein
VSHTPGPWEFRHLSGAQYSMIAGKDSVVAGIPNTDTYAPDDLPMILANGKLVAAAPTMLEALEAVAYWMSDAQIPCCFPRQTVLDAIDKAKVVPTVRKATE